ncbi:MAG TPA: hypothetical protein VHS79_00925 [Actinomycetes bacterium]|nr:hypothetical protein [Actinomycetes bacterium]
MRLRAASSTAEGAAPSPEGPAGARPVLPGWAWVLCWAALAVGIGLLVRLPGPATLDPDEHAAVLYLDRLTAGDRLEEPLLSSSKPLLTVVHGLAWRTAHDWRLLEAVTVAAFALAVVCLARAAGRLGGWPAAAATVLAVAGSGPLVLQAARGNSMVFAVAGWSVALDALTRGGGPGGRARDAGAAGSGPAWALAAGALLLAGLARAESWVLLPLAAAYGLLAWRRGDRRALLLALPLAAPLLWLAHDWLLTGDPLFAVRIPGRYSDLVSGRQVIPPADWLALVARRYATDPLLLVLGVAGAVWLVRRRAWLWLAALGAAGTGVLALLGLQAWQGTYISWRYFDPADLALRLAAALGAAALATWVAGRLGRGRGVVAVAGAVLLAGAACWPLAPADPVVTSTLDRDSRLSANTATAIDVLGPVAAEPGTVLAVSGPQRLRVAVELGLPLDRVRDLFLAGLAAPLDQALAGTAAVFHDADGDRPPERFARLSTTVPTRVGELELVPLRTDPERGLYVHRVEDP